MSNAGFSKCVVRRLDAFGTQVNLALRAVMSRVYEHVHDHGAAMPNNSV